jgi:hypothetical protein
LFAGTRRAERRASNAAVDGLLLRLEKGEQRGHHRGALLQIVLVDSDRAAGVDGSIRRGSDSQRVCWRSA